MRALHPSPSARGVGHALCLLMCSPVLVVVIGSCTGDGPAPAPPDVSDLSVRLSDGEVRCGFVDDEAELIQGPLAFGRVGHAYRCNNSKIRFLIQDDDRPFGNSSRGGNLVDVDLVRPEGEPDFDAFREHVVAVGANEVIVDSIEVVEDGRLGVRGIIRVTGKLGPFTLAPQAAYLSQTMDATVITDYILWPDVDYIEIVTRIINDGDDQIYYPLYADFVAFGGVNRMLTPERGFGDMDFFTRTEGLTAGGSKTSYALVCPTEDPTMLFAESRVTSLVCADDAIIAREDSFTRYIVVGDGSFESVLRRGYELAHRPVGEVSGRVTGPDGTAAGHVMVSAVVGDLFDADEGAVTNQTFTDDDGAFTLTLRPGAYDLYAHTDDPLRSAPVAVSVAEGDAKTADLSLPAAGQLQLHAVYTDGAGGPLPVLPTKFSVRPLDGTARPSPTLGDFTGRGLVQSVPTADGEARITLAPGAYEVSASRGFEFSADQVTITVPAGGTADASLALVREIDSSGAVAAEFHQHTIKSTDGTVPLVRKVLENAAEGIEYTASTDHDNIADFGPAVVEAGVAEHLVAIAGDEVSYQAIGHFNVYPWAIDPADPCRDIGARLWWDKSVAALFADIRERAGDPIIQMNHPRSDNAGVFSAFRLNPLTGERPPRPAPTLPGLAPDVYTRFTNNFEAIELNGSLGNPATFTEAGLVALADESEANAGDVPVLADYFVFLGSGLPVVATGNSDTHRVAEGVGYPRNFLFVGTDDALEVDDDRMRDAVRAQRVAVGNGCLATFHVGDRRPMGHAEPVSAADAAGMSLQVQAPSWASVSRVELYRNGRVVPIVRDGDALLPDDTGASLWASLDEGSTGRMTFDLSALPSADDDLWFAVARGPGLPDFAHGSTFCYTAPLYVDDGDGWVGWLADTTQLIVDE